MKFKESPYYDEGFLGKKIYNLASDYDELLTIQEFFNINDDKKEYHIKARYKDYELKVCNNYYEFNLKSYADYLFLVFDKPVYITGEYCRNVIAPEIIIKNSKNTSIFRCVVNKLVVGYISDFFEMNCSKINSIYFYNSAVLLWKSEADNFFIFDKNLRFHDSSNFSNHYKVKFFGSCDDLKYKMLKYKNFKEGVIHIE